jgi:hypothetical protein
MEDINVLATELDMEPGSLRVRFNNFMVTDEGRQIRSKASELGNLRDDGSRKRLQPIDKIIRYVENHPGCDHSDIGKATGIDRGRVRGYVVKQARDKIHIQKLKGKTSYWIKGTEPEETEEPKKKGYLSNNGAVRFLSRYYLDLEPLEPMAEEVGVSVQAIRQRFTGLKDTKTYSDIITKAGKLGHLTPAGKRLRADSPAFAKARARLGHAAPEPTKEDAAEEVVQITSSTTLDSLIDLLAKRIAHYLKEGAVQ